MRQHALMDTSDQVTRLRKTLAKQKKAELLGALVDMATGDRRVLRELQSRFEDIASPDQLVRATQQAIEDATQVDESRLNYNFSYDYRAYETIQRNLQTMVDSDCLEEAMELSLKLMKQGSYQVEMSDEGLMTEDISECLKVVIEAISKSDLPAQQVIDWCNAMTRADGVGFICDRELASLLEQVKKN